MIDYLKYRSISYIFSVVLIGLFLGGIAYRYFSRGSMFLYGVEFSGGVQVTFSTNIPLNSDEITQIVDDAHLGGASIRQFSQTEHLVRASSDQNYDVVDQLKASFARMRPDAQLLVQQVEIIGAGVGDELKPKAIVAVLCALLLMLCYVWIRFRSAAYAVANFISLGHDVLVILLCVVWFDYELSLDIVGAVLFILGYSINDTIVIFSRIRENMSKRSQDGAYTIVNLSINETLRRTLLTSFFTTLVVVPLLLFGGATLKSLSAALLLGIVFGTYSSIFIASPLVYDLKRLWAL